MSSYLDYMMYSNNNSQMPRNMYDQQLSAYQQQLAQLQQNNPFSGINQQAQQNQQPATFNNFVPNQMAPQTPVQQVVQQPMQQQQQQQQQLQNKQNDLYLQSLFMEFLRSPEMKDFTNTFYTKFSHFYKNKTGLEYSSIDPSFNYPSNPMPQQVAPTQPQQMTPTSSQSPLIAEPSATPKYIIEH